MEETNINTRTIKKFLFLPKQLVNSDTYELERRWLQYAEIYQIYDSIADRWISIFWMN